MTAKLGDFHFVARSSLVLLVAFQTSPAWSAPEEPAPSSIVAPASREADKPEAVADEASSAPVEEAAQPSPTSTVEEPPAALENPAAADASGLPGELADNADGANPEPTEAQALVSEPEADQASAENTEALLARLDAQLAEGDASTASSNTLSLYGFSDVAFHKYMIRSDSPLQASLYTKSTFAVGNLNLYLAGDLGAGWSSLNEVRFTYLPNGSRQVSDVGVERTDTTVSDYTILGFPRRTGGIFIERAWLQYMADPLLTIRAGQWLTPYGIWIEDHGSPTIIGVRRPYVIGLELLPERQTGIQLRGTGYFSESWSLGYALGLSNGRGPVHEYADLDENKAVTARLTATHRGDGTLQLGTSAYFGRFTNAQQELVLSGDVIRFQDSIVEQYDEQAFAFDARYTLGGFHSQAELIFNEARFTEEGRIPRTSTTFFPDRRQYGGYMVTGYRFDWLGLMPYIGSEYFHLANIIDPTLPDDTVTISVSSLGLNSRPTHNVTLKLEGSIGYFLGDFEPGSSFKHPLGGIQVQAAYAF